MREILFKGKTISDNRWVISDSIKQENDRVFLYDEVKDIDVEVDPETVGQYTGLTDKNGVNVFEGDIVNITYPTTIVHNTVIKYVGASFYGETRYDFWELDDYVSLEIIGNKYDNKDLL